MDNNDRGIKVAEAAACFIEGITEERESFQHTINHFARWFGKDKVFCELMPPEIANYADRLAISDSEYAKKLEIVRVFLAFAKKEGFVKTNLSTHLKSKKCKLKNNNNNTIKKDAPQKVTLTSESYEKIKNELEELKKQRPAAIEEVSKAAADKDFRENAPLDAARERLSHLEGKIIELQEILKITEIDDECKKDTDRAGIGDCIVLTDLSNMEKLEYTLVSAREYDPAKGKISSSSPLGKAIVGKGVGENIEVVVPVGKLCYKIEKIEHTKKVKNKK